MLPIFNGSSKPAIYKLITTSLSVGVIATQLSCASPGAEKPVTNIPLSATDPAAAALELKLNENLFPKAGIPADLPKRISEVISRMPVSKFRQSGRAHILMRMDTPPDSDDAEYFKKQGITLLHPYDKHTWYASVTTTGADFIGRTQETRNKRISSADLIKPEFKLAEELLKDDKPQKHRQRSGDRLAYSVLFHKDVSAEEVIALGKQLDMAFEEFDPKAFSVVRVVTINLPLGELGKLIASDIVKRVEPAPPPDINHNEANAQPYSNVDRVQLAPFSLNGNGITVGVWEATERASSGFNFRSTHRDLAPRAFIEEASNVSNHATHVAGTIGSTGINASNTEGMAPRVNLTSWGSASDTTEMTNAARSPGGSGQLRPIQISNHSYGWLIGWSDSDFYGHNDFGRYTGDSQSFDNVVFQTGLTVVKSAGNDRNDAPPLPVPGQPADCLQGGFGVAADCIGPKGVAKNVITVGAMNGASGTIAGFSSYGPTDDGRIKPDLVAHGVSTVSLGRHGDDAQDTMDGTSMSSPVVAGIAALVLQEASKLGTVVTPAGIKALLIQTARDIRGTGQATPGPDYATGWGAADAEAAINLLRQSGLVEATLTGTGAANAWTKTFFVAPEQTDVHVTLAWDDPAGSPGGQILVNDLDLRLIDPNGREFTPWRLNPDRPGDAAVEDGGNDTVNNVEQVSAFNTNPGTPVPGIWTAKVSASANNGNLVLGPQKFAVAGITQNPQIQVPGDLDVSKSCINRTKTKTLNVCNTGKDDLIVNSISSSNTEFSVTEPTAGYPLVVGKDFCFPFQVNFKPATTGSRAVNLRIASNDPLSPITTVAAFGKGIKCNTLIQVPGSVDFGESCVDSKKTETLNVCNTGKKTLIVDPISSSNPQFSVTTPSSGYPVEISHDFCFPFEVAFTPTAEGTQTGKLKIPSSDPANPSTEVDVSGIGSTPDIRVTGSTDFGFTSAWTPAEKTVAVCNTGSCDLSVTSAAIDCPDFSLIDSPLPADVQSGSCMDLLVGFTPQLQGQKSCQLSIASNDPDTPTVTRTLTARTPPAFSLHAGKADATGALGSTTNDGGTLNLGFIYPVTPRFSWDGRMGFSAFDGTTGNSDVDLLNLSGNAKFTVNPAHPINVFINGGAGLYHFNPGDVELGINLGLGLHLPVGPRFGLEATYNYHNAFTASPDLKFNQLQFGLITRF